MLSIAHLSNLLVIISVSYCYADKILLVPGTHHSHCAEMGFIATELLNRRHTVVLYFREDLPVKRCITHKDIRVITYPKEPGIRNVKDMFEEQARQKRANVSTPAIISNMLNGINRLCWENVKDKTSIALLGKEKFDLAIVNGLIVLNCLFSIPYKLKIPYVSVSAYLMDINNAQFFVPQSKAMALLPLTCDMSFIERLQNTIVQLAVNIFMKYFKTENYVLMEIAPELSGSNLVELFHKSKMFIENSDVVMGCPKPILPNFIQVGGMTARPAKPLSADLEELYANSDGGVIVAAFGSTLEDMPEETIAKFIQAFEKVNITVLLKWTKIPASQNVKFIDWLPQNDVLGHPKTKLLIYHCGFNGVMESVYHGVPIICLPMSGDQNQVAASVAYRGAGLVLNMGTFTVDELVDAINEVLRNRSYRMTSKRLSEIFKSRTESPESRAATAIEHVLRFGDDHLRSPATELSFFQYALLDVWFVIITVPLLIFYIFIRLFFKVISLCWRGKTSRKIKSQ